MFTGPNCGCYWADRIGGRKRYYDQLRVTGDSQSTERLFLTLYDAQDLMEWPKFPFTLYLQQDLSSVDTDTL